MKTTRQFLKPTMLVASTAVSAGILFGAVILISGVWSPAVAQSDRGPSNFHGGQNAPAKKNVEEGGSGSKPDVHGSNAAGDDSEDDDESADDNSDNSNDGVDSPSGNNSNAHGNQNTGTPCVPPNKHGCKPANPL